MSDNEDDDDDDNNRDDDVHHPNVRQPQNVNVRVEHNAIYINNGRVPAPVNNNNQYIDEPIPPINMNDYGPPPVYTVDAKPKFDSIHRAEFIQAVPDQVLYARDSTVCGDHIYVIGNHNMVMGNECFVFGDDNTVDGKSCTVVGKRNTCVGYTHRSYTTLSNMDALPVPANRVGENQQVCVPANKVGENQLGCIPVNKVDENKNVATGEHAKPGSSEAPSITKKRKLDVDLTKGEDIGSTPTCTICMERDVNTVLLPCGHAKFCNQCLEGICDLRNSDCPECRQVFTTMYRIYL